MRQQLNIEYPRSSADYASLLFAKSDMIENG